MNTRVIVRPYMIYYTVFCMKCFYSGRAQEAQNSHHVSYFLDLY